MAALASSVAVVASTPSKHRNKKRPTSPGNSGGAAAKKKKIGQNIILDTTGENKSLATDSSPGHGELAVKPLIFKDPNFIHSGVGGAGAGKKSRIWKNLKQILATERMLPWKLNDPNYSSIDALPSFKPAKKYSDISGLPIYLPLMKKQPKQLELSVSLIMTQQILFLCKAAFSIYKVTQPES
ncbi:INO80 complex subunit C isoform X2 [Carcharodon carcharias]|uniref:INO80 complex subunit C isoform X2 n=1 Tax=Carcharodon carcharias TaxID=13397 RepID=UPI001B7E3433|nr:INO80 complex subunit C isoform X2 [Carcharodon carcharias]